MAALWRATLPWRNKIPFESLSRCLDTRSTSVCHKCIVLVVLSRNGFTFFKVVNKKISILVSESKIFHLAWWLMCPEQTWRQGANVSPFLGMLYICNCNVEPSSICIYETREWFRGGKSLLTCRGVQCAIFCGTLVRFLGMLQKSTWHNDSEQIFENVIVPIFCKDCSKSKFVRLEVFTAVTTKNGVIWDVTPYGSCKNRRFGGA
jgi:hypothetical protein